MRTFHFHNNHRVHLAFSDFWLYELSVWLHTLAQSLVSIFIPVLMLKSGYSVADVVLYCLMLNVFDVPLNFVARSLVRRYGARVTIGFATAASIAFFLLFLQLSSGGWLLLLLLALCAAVYDAFYWVAHFYLFVNSGGSAKSAGQSTSIVYVVRQFAVLLGPVIGAMVLIFSSQHVLLFVTIFCLLVSLLPLIKVDAFPDKPKDAGLSFKEFFRLAHTKRLFLSMACYSIHDSVENILFPVFIFLIFGTIASVAFIPVILSIVAIAVSFGLGRLRPERRELSVALAAFAISLIWLIRIASGGPIVYYISVLAVGLCAYFVMVPLDSAVFEHGHRVKDTLSAAMYRNVTYMSVNVFLFGLLAFFLQVFQPSFVLAAASLLGIVAVNALPLVGNCSPEKTF